MLVHIVLFEFNPHVHVSVVDDVCSRMVGLASKCLHPTTGKPYISAALGGRDNSPEGHQGGMTHGFVMHFENKEDRDYYVNEDPVHKAFVETLDGVVIGMRVVDFVEGVF